MAPTGELAELSFVQPPPDGIQGAAPTATPPASTVARGSLQRYRAALRLVRDGELDAALQALEHFVDVNPRHPYTDNALYWIGEVHYMKRDYARALSAFDRVLREYGDGNRAPDALLKKAYCFERMGQSDQARSVRALLLERYPQSGAARSLVRGGAS